jgi:hypothetical protein
MQGAGIRYSLAFGSLLGYVRHQGDFVPWDDDMDVIVDERFLTTTKGRAKLEEALKAAGLLFVRGTSSVADRLAYPLRTYVPYKVFLPTADAVPHYRHRHPFIDLFAVRDLADEYVIVDGPSLVSVPTAFQVTRGEFASVPVSVPTNPQAQLKALYGSDWDKFAMPPTMRHVSQRKTGFPARVTPLEDATHASWHAKYPRNSELPAVMVGTLVAVGAAVAVGVTCFATGLAHAAGSKRGNDALVGTGCALLAAAAIVLLIYVPIFAAEHAVGTRHPRWANT